MTEKDTRTEKLNLSTNPPSGYTFQSIENKGEIIPLGSGGSGIVYKAYQDMHSLCTAERAIKFFMYRDDIAESTKHKKTGPISIDDFREEVKNITSFNHQFLVKVIEAGIHKTIKGDIPYIVTDFVNGPTLHNILNGDNFLNSQEIRNKLESDPDLIIDLIINIAGAIKHIHQRNFSHCDIKPKNIFIEFKDGNISPIVGDFGISKPLDESSKRESVYITGSPNWIPDYVNDILDKEIPYSDFVKLQPHWDIFSLSKTSLEALSKIQSAKNCSWYKPLYKDLSKGLEKNKYKKIDDLINRIEFLLPTNRTVAGIPELSSAIGAGFIKMMPVEALKTTDRLEKVISHPSVTRLLKVPQLTTSNKILPGACHTRYEHTLGVIEAMRRYILSLLDESEFLEHFSPAKVETAILCAAYLSASRFPFSNVVHELRDKDKNLFKEFSKRDLINDVFEMQDHYGETAKDIISDYFKNVDIENVKIILSRSKNNFDDEDNLIFSLLHSSLDVRVIDFVRRDAHHLGIISGESFTLNDILPHVTVHDHRLALKETGVSVAEQIISLRYWLFSRVYWNRPSRTFCSMAKYLLVEISSNHKFISELRRKIFEFDQNEFIKFLLVYCQEQDRKDLVDICYRLLGERKKLYGVVYEVNRTSDPEFASYMDKLSKFSYSEQNSLSEYIEEKLSLEFPKEFFKEKDFYKPILLDYPEEPGSTKLGSDISVISKLREIESLDNISGIVSGINSSFINQVTKFRVFLHPRLFPESALRSQYEKIVKNSIIEFIR